ncbi:MAG: hypothetical protein ABS876_03330, partial [Ruminococcus sp.]
CREDFVLMRGKEFLEVPLTPPFSASTPSTAGLVFSFLSDNGSLPVTFSLCHSPHLPPPLSAKQQKRR